MEDFDLLGLLRSLRKRLYLIILLTLLTVSLSLIYTFFYVTPTFEASTSLIVNQGAQTATTETGEVVTIPRTNEAQLIPTFRDIIQSSAILDAARAEIGGEKFGTVNVLTSSDSRVFKIVVTDSDAERAAEFANQIAKKFKEKIPDILSVNNVSILSPAQPNYNQISPSIVQNILMGFAVGIIFSIIFALLLDYLDNTIKTEKDVDYYLDLPILGAIPKIRTTN